MPLYTDQEDWGQWSLQEHLEMSGDDSLTKEDKQNLMLFDKIGDGIFIHTEENRGYIDRNRLTGWL